MGVGIARGASARLRLYGAGLRTDPSLPVGGAAFVLTTLATVVYDGWSQTDRFGSFQQWFWDRWSFLATHVSVLQTLSMLAVVAIFVAAYLFVTRREAVMFAPTLIPIAAVYFTAHYFAYLLIAGQATLGVIIDPFGLCVEPPRVGRVRALEGDRPGRRGVGGPGHPDRLGTRRCRVRRASPGAARFDRAGSALVAQAPLVGLMVRLHRGRAVGARAADQGLTVTGTSTWCCGDPSAADGANAETVAGPADGRVQGRRERSACGGTLRCGHRLLVEHLAVADELHDERRLEHGCASASPEISVGTTAPAAGDSTRIVGR